MIYDLCVIGGGINGAGIARDAAGRGLRVLLLEAGDLAQGTSSSSSKMIHGGLRYLEFFEFGLVRKSLAERETLLRVAPQIIHPLRLCIPHRHSVRPAWMVRAGLFIYDHLTRMNVLPKSETLNLAHHDFGKPLQHKTGIGFAYSDCWVDDSRLVVLNAMDAKLHGADIYVQTPVTKMTPWNGIWDIETPAGLFQARIMINATGPHVRHILEQNNLVHHQTPKLRLVQGSHIVVPKLYDGDQAYMIQCPDKRVVFVFPYEGQFSLIGTTETVLPDSTSHPQITDEEKDYLCAVVQREFEKKITKSDIIWSYSGVRPLFDAGDEADARKVTRDYKLELDDWSGSKILNVFGGKITTYRPLAEEAMEILRPYFPDMGKCWTGEAPLPMVSLEFKPDEKTVSHFITHEFARHLDDIIWRRTKWGLHMTEKQIAELACLLDKKLKEIGDDQNTRH
jgi:glycerol-3-phosphate dehydrogenase